MNATFESVDAYIASFPETVREILQQIRAIVREVAPDAVEKMAYGMPGYKTQGKPLIYFAAFEQHVGLYATPTANIRFADQLSVYKHGKGSIQFPLKAPIPYDFIREIVDFRYLENQLRAKPIKSIKPVSR